MTSRPSISRRLKKFPPEAHNNLGRRHDGIITVPNILAAAGSAQANEGFALKLTKLLLKVTVERSLGAVQVVMEPEKTVADLIKAVVDVYVKEKRRPLLKDAADCTKFQLHYSQFSLESLRPGEKLINLGSRNFFLCSKTSASASSLCSQVVEKSYSQSLQSALLNFLL